MASGLWLPQSRWTFALRAEFLRRLGRLLWALTLRDLKSRYLESGLGLFWTVIHPLATLLLYTVVFSYFLKLRIRAEGLAGNFPIWLFCGFLPWLTFSDSVARCSGVWLENARWISRTIFPMHVLPISLILSQGIHHLVGVLLLAFLVVLFGGSFGTALILLPVYVLSLGMFSLGVGLLVSNLTIIVRDVSQFVGLGLSIWFFLTPIVYPVYLVPDAALPLYYLNPLVHLVEGYRAILLHNSMPSPLSTLYVVGATVITLALGTWFHRKTRSVVMDLL